MKKYTTTLLLLASLILSGCTGGNVPQEVPPKTDESTPPIISTTNQPDYFFIDSHFLGSYSDDGWHSPSAITEVSAYTADEEETASATPFLASEIASAASYQLYTIDEFIGSTEEIIWPLEADGLSSFGSDNSSQFTVDMQEALTSLALPVIAADTKEPLSHYGRIPLPVDFTDSPLAELTMPYYNAHSYFALENELNVQQYPVRLATSALHDPRPHKVQVLYELPEALETALYSELSALGLPDAPLHLSDYYASDFDHDGLEESLIIIQTDNGESGYPLVTEAERMGQSGVYHLIYYIDDEKADPAQTLQPVFSWVNAYTPEVLNSSLDEQDELINIDYCRQLIFLGTFDLNGDGTLEFALQHQMWEGGEIRIYSLDESTEPPILLQETAGDTPANVPDENLHYRTVLLSRYGM